MITTHDSALYLAKQTGRGVYPSAPTYMFQLTDGALTSKPTIQRLNIRDGRLFGSSKKIVSYIDTGGQPTLTMQPKGMGAVVAWGTGNDTPSGEGDPYSHVGIPPTTLTPGDYPYLTGWQYDLGKWSVFHDLQIIGFEIELGLDVGHARIKPTFVGMAKEQHLATADLPALPSEEEDDVHWLDASGYHCGFAGDWTNIDHSSAPTDLAGVETWQTNFKTKWNAHCAVSSGRHHKAADAVNTLGYSTPPADQAACITNMTAIRAAIIAHEASTSVHYFADTTDNNPSAAWVEPCTTLAQLLVAAQDCIGNAISPGCYNRHVGAVANIRKILFTFDQKAAPWQGAGATAYTVIRKPGDILIAVDQLQEDLRLINLAKFGTPIPTTGTEVSTEIQTLGFTSKFTTSVSGNERSFKLDVPQFDLDPGALLNLTGNSEGNELVPTIAGEASGSAPICTLTTVNDVAAY